MNPRPPAVGRGLARLARSVLFALALLPLSAWAARWTLVQFGAREGATLTPYGDWTEVLRDTDHTIYADPDGQPDHAGLVEADGIPEGQWAWFGIRGTTPILLQPGHRIIATFFNRTDEYAYLVVRVSFTDRDAPDPADPSHPWFTMQNGRYRDDGDWMPPHELVAMEFAVADAGQGNAIDGPASTGPCHLVNLSKPYNDTHFVLTKIEIADDADRCPPAAPVNVSVLPHATTTGVTDNAVRLHWEAPPDCATNPTGISRYLIYRDGVLHDSVDRRTTGLLGQDLEYLDLEVAPGSTHRYEVSAIDAALGGTYPVPGRMTQRVGNESPRSAPQNVTLPAWTSTTLIDPYGQLEYLGGFRLPAGHEESWEESSSAMTFRPDGNPSLDPTTELPGSLFLYTHLSREIAEITIPRPVRSTSIRDWPRARLLNGPVDLWPVIYEFDGVATSVPPGGTEYRVAGLAYHPAAGGLPALLYYGNCNFYGSEASAAGHGWFSLDLQSGGGGWFIGATPPDQVYPGLVTRLAFTLPAEWAAQHTGGRTLVVGDTFLSGGQVVANGPSLYAVAPWEQGRLPTHGEAISAVEMLRYSDAPELEHRVLNFRIDETGQGAAWLVAGKRSALAIAYRRTLGDLWYGDSLGNNDAYHDIPEPVFGDKGAGATDWKTGLMFYSPEDLADVCNGRRPASTPQPYCLFDLDRFSLRPEGGTGQAGGLAYDPASGYVFFIEHNGDPEFPSQPVIHVWHLLEAPASADPRIMIRRQDGLPVLNWEVAGELAETRLETATRVVGPWEDIGPGSTVADHPDIREYQVTLTPSVETRFFRLVSTASGGQGR